MQAPRASGDQSKHLQQFAACDPQILAYAQKALLTYPTNPFYQQIMPVPQLQQFVLSPQLLQNIPGAAQVTNHKMMSQRGSTIPEMDVSFEEPIVAGSFMKHRSKPTSEEKPSFNRRSTSWESMTDEDRENITRIKRKEDAFKTALCDAYKRSGNCPYGFECRFAHGENELRMPLQPRGKAHPKYKTQLCDKFSLFGQCPYGPRCQFIHKLKKGLPLLEYNRFLAQGQISPARDDEITNPDESDHSIYRTNLRRRDLSDSGYDGGRITQSSRRNLAHHVDSMEEVKKPIYPAMQVVNIEMATGQKPSRRENRRSVPSSVINQADYQASMAGGKIYGKPENIRHFGAMVRANEEHVERATTGNVKIETTEPEAKRLSPIEEVTMSDASQVHQTNLAISQESQGNNQNNRDSQQQSPAPWYVKIFGKKMTVIREESIADDSLQHDMTQTGQASEDNGQ